MDVKNLLLEKNNFKTFLKAQPALIKAKKEIQVRFWKALKKALHEKGREFEFFTYGFEKIEDIETAVSDYVDGKQKSKCFGLKRLPSKRLLSDTEYELFPCVEIYHEVYYGYGASKKSVRIKDIKRYKALKGIKNPDVRLDKSGDDEDWIFWKWPEKRLNFKEFNSENIFGLFNEETLNETVRKIAEDIDRMIKEFEEKKGHLLEQYPPSPTNTPA